LEESDIEEIVPYSDNPASMAPIVSSASSSPSAWSTTSDPSSPESAVSYSSSSSPTQTLPLPHRTKTARSEAKSKTFLWIDSQADDGKGSTVRKQKQAFVVKKIHEERKKASIERLKATKPPPPAAPPKPSLALERSGTIQRAIDDGQEGQEEDITRPSPEEAIAMAEAWSLMPYLSQGFMDPFNCYSIDMTSTMHMYLDYCMWRSAPLP
jgi:hypothetical protein